jgi:redox-sensitive bicupin YhaK (pirin superfamily)
MTIVVRPAAERGHADHGWLDSRHTFSFADYRDPRHMGFGPLRVINEDRVRGGAGFPTHGHRDMEIISYVLEGGLEHRDSIGTGSVIRPGDVQVMSAGSGVRHSEFNASASEPVHFLQIWIIPEATDLPPRYQQKAFSAADKAGRLRLIVSHDGRGGSLSIRQDADVYATRLTEGERVAHKLKPGRRAWAQIVEGAATINGASVAAGDGAAIEAVDTIAIAAGAGGTELLLFDMVA